MSFREKLAKRARTAGLALDSNAISALNAYFALLAKWNTRVSLTSLRVADGDDEAVDRLLLEPMLAAKYLPAGSPLVIDIGSGGGSPAIPLKVYAPKIGMVMVESRSRKAAFLREAVRQLRLSRTTVEAARFETMLVRPEFTGSADVVTIRAVRVEPKTLAALTRLLKPGGTIFLFRSDAAGAELGLSDGTIRWDGTHTLLPHLNSSLVIFRKPA